MTARSSTVPTGAMLLVASGVLLLRPLARFWSENDDYAYGWGVPLLAAFLFYERWRCRPAPKPSGSTDGRGLAVIALGWAALVLALRLILETEPGSRPLLWLDASVWISALLVWTGLLGGRPWLRHFAFPVLFLLVAVPWIFRCEFLLVQNLMRANAAAVAATLRLSDLPAYAAGNTIQLRTGQLGVSEACSGIRSLQAALMMALFFGEFYRFGRGGRAALLAAGTALALAGNFARMLYLAWRGAIDGVPAVEAAHDSTGWTVLVATLAGLWLICLATRRTRPPVGFTAWSIDRRASRCALRWASSVLLATLFAEAATQAWYGFRNSSAPHYPAWSVAWPRQATDFRATVLPEDMRRQLHAAATSAATWRDAAGARWDGLWIRYRAGAEGKIVFESHNPGLCLPAAGWRPLPGTETLNVRVGQVQLTVLAQSFATPGGTTHVLWIPYLDGGVRANADRVRGLYGHTFAALAGGRFPWLEDVWRGCRGADAETLEIAATGPPSLAAAVAAFRNLAPRLIRPVAGPAAELASDP